ncbi:hypothetical protein SAMN05216207_10935 [Pseudonocardia ammonioxydans]|uniref:Uncharacterized protein n=1 Tax=Pseudonocardia ammonioxydans TaxID=260086 RepID=A0A1I5IAM8_PSUAM|nr:hypothetical protein [Pseudonocardia ammonioxydans]SFO57280.1 hypothetical protein SAMN05216207_10935 [Pseudonocardia ammonioxydans]
MATGIGVAIFLALLGAFICAKARVPAGAVVFSLIALALFVATPLGQGVPGAVEQFVSTVDGAATPVLNGEGSDGVTRVADQGRRPA